MSKNFGMVGNKILVKKKDTLLYVPKFWYGREQNSGEKERHSRMSQNFGKVGNKILVKKKDTPVCPKILVRSGTKFW